MPRFARQVSENSPARRRAGHKPCLHGRLLQSPHPATAVSGYLKGDANHVAKNPAHYIKSFSVRTRDIFEMVNIIFAPDGHVLTKNGIVPTICDPTRSFSTTVTSRSLGDDIQLTRGLLLGAVLQAVDLVARRVEGHAGNLMLDARIQRVVVEAWRAATVVAVIWIWNGTLESPEEWRCRLMCYPTNAGECWVDSNRLRGGVRSSYWTALFPGWGGGGCVSGG